MRSIEHVVHIEGRSASHTARVVARGQQPHEPASSSSSPLPTIRIQQATVSQAQRFTIASDTVMITSPTMSATITETAVPAQKKDGLSTASIAGLAMIPVVVLLIVVAASTYFWLRKRRRQDPEIRCAGPTRPAIPEKDFRLPNSSFDSTASGGKLRSMTAMSTPVTNNGWVASPRPRARPSYDSTVHRNPWHDQLPKISADITTASLQAPRRDADEGNDSPIDRSSPFRLKRGDTRKKSSLDADVMSAWPAPPQPVAQRAPLQTSRVGKTYMERRSISAEYFAQEKDHHSARGAQDHWENIRLELAPDPGPVVRSH
ncbi:uncharacterized protein M421DRAFT_203126 [Didymella exigua CBS 183.55]|uniref:Uncharacterized protein n=1 Tax=Didymella exigua CBS 183.55 TaxID=1150837 RepID=A0A6A5S1G5_9PLEO|nr:uncharacterized protein M421DRAFT_203126 [Didymella exigua CBS 183.55]KAF1933733.1 hypothetical protein M421DRAFT_203126 [Didymella exigua CBS 183.55]